MAVLKAPGGGGLIYETDGDAHRLALECKFWTLVSPRVFQAKRQYFLKLRVKTRNVK